MRRKEIKNRMQALILSATLLVSNICYPIMVAGESKEDIDVLETEKIIVEEVVEVTETVIEQPVIVEPVEEIIVTEPEPIPSMSTEDIDLLALVTMAEAEGESEYGKRLVIDVILNRVDNPEKFGNTVSEVIYQKGQFEAMWNGRVNRSFITDEVRQLVIEELESRTNSEVLYFRTNRYHSFGTPELHEGNHYFSS